MIELTAIAKIKISVVLYLYINKICDSLSSILNGAMTRFESSFLPTFVSNLKNISVLMGKKLSSEVPLQSKGIAAKSAYYCAQRDETESRHYGSQMNGAQTSTIDCNQRLLRQPLF